LPVAVCVEVALVSLSCKEAVSKVSEPRRLSAQPKNWGGLVCLALHRYSRFDYIMVCGVRGHLNDRGYYVSSKVSELRVIVAERRQKRLLPNYHSTRSV